MCSVASNICSMQCTLCTVQLVYPLELSNPSWHVDTPDHYCWSTLGIVVSLTCQPGLAPSTVATSYNRLCCLQMINLGLAYGIMIQAECLLQLTSISFFLIKSAPCVSVCFHRNQSIETDLPRFVKFVSAVGSLKLFMVSETSSRRIPPCSQLQCFSKNTSQLLFPKCAFLGSTDNGCYLLLKCPKLVNWQNLWPLDC